MNQIFHTPRGEYLVISTAVPNNKFVDMTLDIYEKKDLGEGRFTFQRVLLLPLVCARDDSVKQQPQKPQPK